MSPSTRSAAATTRGMDDVLQTARILWPPPFVVDHEVASPVPSLTWPDGRGAACEDSIILPNSRAPRLCVPTGSARAASRSMLRFNSALRPREVVARLGSTAAVATRLRPLLRHRLSVAAASPGDDCIGRHLGRVMGQPVVFSFGIGSLRVNRKPVLALFSSEGDALGYAKVGVNDFTDAQVLREASALRSLGGVDIPGVSTPQLIDCSSWNGHPVLVMSALRPGAWSTATTRRRVPFQAMAALAAAFGTRECALAECRWWHELTHDVRQLRPGPARAGLDRTIGAVTARWGASPVTLGAWHGDWTPWNMGRSGRRVLLWDFERFDRDAPVGMDVLHYAVNTGGAGALTAGTVLERLRTAFGRLPGRSVEPTVAAYLASISARYLIATEAPHGSIIAARALTMVEALECWVEESRRERLPR